MKISILNNFISKNFFGKFIFLNTKILLKYIKKHKSIYLIFISVIILIRTIYSIYIFEYKYHNDEYNKNRILLVLNKEKQTDTYISYLVKINEKNMYIDKFILYIFKDKNMPSTDDFYLNYGNFKYGDIIQIKGKIDIPKTLNNLYEFNYKRYLNSKNIIGTIMSYNAKKTSYINNIFSYIYLLKSFLSDQIDNKLPGLEGSLFKSMVYGDDSSLTIELKDNFTKVGLSHLLAVSGSNVGIIILLFTFISKKININNIITFIMITVTIFVFCTISDFEISVIRASIISIIILILKFLSIKINKFIPIIIACVAIILYNPYSIFSVSFILSFSAFLGIIVFSKLIYSKFYVYIVKILSLNNVIMIENNKSNKSMNILFKVMKSVANILSIYLSVQIVIIPVQIYFFNSIPIISILSNLIIYFFSSIELILGFLFYILCYVPYVSDILANLNYVILYIIIKIVNILANLNIYEIKMVTPNIISILCYYTLVIVIFYGYKIKYYLKYKYRKINFECASKILCIFCVMYIIYFNVYTKYFSNFVYYFNVEQGNMTLIKNRDKIILVDMGTTSSVDIGNILESFLNSYNIQKIDFLIITHLHSDHVNCLFKLEDKLKNNKIKIESIIYAIPKNNDNVNINNFTENSISFTEFENFLNRNKIKQIVTEQFDKIVIKGGITIDILSPKTNEIIYSKDIVNSNSMSVIISINKVNFLFMGDSTIETENEIIRDINGNQSKEYFLNKLNKIESIQVGHHGSNTSTSENLLKNIKIKEAVISSKKSVYGHPSLSVVNLLKKYKIKVYITEVNGGIMLKY